MKSSEVVLFFIIFGITLLLSIYSGTTFPEKYPSTDYILEHPQEHEGLLVCVRGTINDMSVESGDSVQLHLVRHGKEFTAYVPHEYLENPEEGDIVDLRGVSHLEEGYVLVEEALHREEWEHQWLFYRSLIGLLVLGVLLMVDWRRLRKVVRLG